MYENTKKPHLNIDWHWLGCCILFVNYLNKYIVFELIISFTANTAGRGRSTHTGRVAKRLSCTRHAGLRSSQGPSADPSQAMAGPLPQ